MLKQQLFLIPVTSMFTDPRVIHESLTTSVCHFDGMTNVHLYCFYLNLDRILLETRDLGGFKTREFVFVSPTSNAAGDIISDITRRPDFSKATLDSVSQFCAN